MLAKLYRTAEELGLKESERDALLDVLDRLERGEFVHLTRTKARRNYDVGFGFNMSSWCGSVGCIGGWCDTLHGTAFGEGFHYGLFQPRLPPDLDDLFAGRDGYWTAPMTKVTPRQAAQGLRNYLETGKPRWKAVMGKTRQVKSCRSLSEFDFGGTT